jgi:hypothetical protein
MDIWDQACYEEQIVEDMKNQIQTLLDGQNLVMFFKKGDKLYGTSEESRVIFAKMKHPDEDVSSAWKKDASFMALSLDKALTGVKAHNIFSDKDMKEIKIIDKEKMEKLLLDRSKKVKKPKPNTIEPTDQEPIEPDKPQGMINLKDKK